MIYDYQDMSTKVYLAQSVRDWCSVPGNRAILSRNNTLKDITGIAIDDTDIDHHVYTVLFLFGVGLLRYFIHKIGNTMVFQVVVDPAWELPEWMQNKLLLGYVGEHVEIIMDAEMMTRGEPIVALQPCLDVIKTRKRRFTPPQAPIIDPANDKRIIRLRRLEAQQKSLLRS